MSIAAELLQRHIQTLVDDHQQWQGLIADNIVWELAYAPAIGHPAKLSGCDEVLHHVSEARRCAIGVAYDIKNHLIIR